jgi:glycosyltransferase involved in cell wall biosynthesis
MMRIGIDGIAVSHPQPGGYRTYTTNLVTHLFRLDAQHSFVLFIDRPVALDLPPNWQVEVVSRRLPVLGVAARQQVGLPRQVRRFQVDLLHSPCGTGPLGNPCPDVVTILDTIEFSTPLPSLRQTRLWAMRLYNRLIQARVARTAEAIITISRYSMDCIVQRFQVPADKISVTHLAPADHFVKCDRKQAIGQVQEGLGLENYVLAFASASPRKNIDRLFDAYRVLDEIRRREFPLVVVCTHPALRKRLVRKTSELGIEADTVFLDRVSDGHLAALMSAASLFVFPSLEEGFGLPPLEAMACGTPVVASNTSSMPEVLGDAALLVSPMDPRELADAMTAVLTSPALAAQLAERGLERSRRFSWEETARQTLAVYEAISQD